jgi:hypothetical protein
LVVAAIMEDGAGEDDKIFIYTGGEQVVPRDVRRVRIDKSVKIIPAGAFQFRRSLTCVEFHDGIKMIEKWAFKDCMSLIRTKLLGVKVVEEWAFHYCSGLTDVEFGDKLDSIAYGAFSDCTSLRIVTMPSVRTIGWRAFYYCRRLTDIALPEGLEMVEQHAFHKCPSLRCITMPLKDNMIEDDVFYSCPELRTVDLVEGIHKTIAFLHLESWKNEIREEINRINLVLSNTEREKTAAIQQWMRSLIRLLKLYKTEHKVILKEATTLLELALWKAKTEEKEECIKELKAKKAKIDIQSERRERRITSGASIVIKNVLPFLQLK